MFKDSSCRHSFKAQPPTTESTTTTSTSTSRAKSQIEESDVVAITGALRTTIEPTAAVSTTTTSATINPCKSYEFECFELELTNSSISSDTNSNSSNNHNNTSSSSSSNSDSEGEQKFTNKEASTATRVALQTAASTSRTVSLVQKQRVGGSQSVKIISEKSKTRKTKGSKKKKHKDVYLLRKIGYIATRVRVLSNIYDNFKLVNPYTPSKQRQLLQEILLKHSLPKSLIEEAENVLNVNNDDEETTVTTITTVTTADTVRRKSSTASASVGTTSVSEVAAVSCSTESCNSSTLSDNTKKHLGLLEEFLIKLYEERGQTLTIIRKQPDKYKDKENIKQKEQTTTTQHQLLIMSDRTSHCSSSNSSSIEGLREEATNILNANTSSQQQQQQQAQPQKQIYLLQTDNQRRRRASDCAAPTSQLLSAQLQVTFKQQQQQPFNNNNRLPLHRGSCGATSEHWLAANTIANRSTIILSKSCNNVDIGLATDRDLATVASIVGVGVGLGGVVGSPETLDSQTTATTTTTTPNGKKQHKNSSSNNGRGNTNEHDNGNDYSIVQLNNTIIQCHFNDDDFRALVKDLKRKVEYAERMNWLREYNYFFFFIL